MARQYFSSRRVVLQDRIASATVAVENGKIVGIEDYSGQGRDFSDLYLMPGLVDTHVHINEPGRTEWEGFETATRAAAAGGYTTVVDMPLNCLPPTTTVASLNAKREAAAGKCHVDWAAWGGVVADNQLDILPLAKAGVPGYKAFLIYPGCEGFTSADKEQLRAALPFVTESGLPLLVHAELAGPIDAAAPDLVNMDWRRHETYLASRPDEAELEAIRFLIECCREFRCRIHIVHLSTARAVSLLAAAKAEGLPITVETCPHYLAFSAEEIPDGATQFKCAPPIRNAANREALWSALAEGVINLVATDHSPCPPSMKGFEEGDFGKAWGGITSLSVALPAMWTEAQARGFSLLHIARWMSFAPAQLAGISDRRGAIAVGYDADFVVFDPDSEWKITTDDLYFRHPVSPFVGKPVKGKVKATYLSGEEVYADGQFPGPNLGRELVHGH